MSRIDCAGEPVPDDVSSLLRPWSDGDQRALTLLMPIVYDDRVLVDHARRHNATRGAPAEHVSVDTEAVMYTDRSDGGVSLDDASNALAERAPRNEGQVEATAEVLHLSAITVTRAWKTARPWLYRELTAGS